MRLPNNFKRMARFLIHRRGEIMSREFWATVSRLIRSRFSFFDRVSANEFSRNLANIEKRPWNLHIETTNICNANCIFCAYQYQQRRKVVMGKDVYTKALNDYCAMGGGELKLQACLGDPLVDPYFLDRIKEARQHPEITEISTITNAVNLDRVGIERLLTSGLAQIGISTGPWREDLYQKIYRHAHYQKVRKNVAALLTRNKDLGCPVAIKIYFRSNLSMKETLGLPDYQAIKDLPHTVEFNADFDTWLGEITQADLLPGMYIRPFSRLEHEPCFWFYDGPMIFSNGNVGLCGCRDFNADSELILGNIESDSLLNLWQSPRAQELRQAFWAGRFPPICTKCTVYANLNFYRSRRGSKRAQWIAERFAQRKV